jgi:hypothetical protein
MQRNIVFLVSFLLMLSLNCTKEVEDHAAVIFFVGEVKINGASVGIGDSINENDTVITGTLSSCDIKIGDSIIRIKERSRVIISQLLKKGLFENVEIGLDIGKMLCKPKKLMKTESFMVKTPTAVAGVRGTQFTVEADRRKTTRIKVFNGKVKVVKRIKRLEEKLDKILDEAPPIEEKEKVVVTEKEVKETEKKVDKAFSKGLQKGVEVEMIKVIEEVKGDIIISRKNVEKFKIEDFKKDNKELIAIKEKSKEVIKKIAHVLKLEKEKPKPDGRLLITKYEIYFIKNGKVIWDGEVINPPIKQQGKIFIASGDYVFCASLDGPVLWRKRISNDGRLKLSGEKLHVYSGRKLRELDIETGQE